MKLLHIEIPIGVLREMLSVEAATGALTWRSRPRTHFKTDREHKIFNTQFAGKACGSLDPSGYLNVRTRHGGKSRLYRAHRIVWALVHGEWPAEQVDHVNRNRSDNRPANLRAATEVQNRFNRPAARESSTGVKGVTFDAKRGRFRARIGVEGKERHLGRFKTLEAAAAVYAAAALEHHGEFAFVVPEARA